MTTEIVFSAQIVPDNFQTFRVNKDALVRDVLPQVLRSLAEKGNSADLSEYRVLVTYQLTVPETTLQKLTVDGSPLADEDSLVDIKFQDGFSILFVKPVVMSTKLELWIENKRVGRISRHETSIGRADPDQGIKPDFDLTPYLGEFERKVSRRQAHISEENGKWKIQLDAESKSAVYLNEQRLDQGLSYEIAHESAISFGPNLEQPYLRIIAKLTSD